jgi:DUF971 family protein
MMARVEDTTPISITANRLTGELVVEWDDLHHSQYPFTLLRAACPCANCRGGHEQMRPEPDPSIFENQLQESPATHLIKVDLVGSYGLTIEWKDGHHFGIYNWHYLRLLCPCLKCRKEYGENDE